MNYVSGHQALLFLLVVQALTVLPSIAESNLEIPTCTPSCKELSSTKNASDFACSCSSSCEIYGDCCRDAPFRNTGDVKQNLGCVLLSGLGDVSVVNSCPPSARKSYSNKCANHVATRVPVTSKDTGASYSNRYCALCNNEKSPNLFEWPVQFRCFDRNKEMAKRSISDCVKHDKQRKKQRLDKIRSTMSPCECKYHTENGALNFTKSLELRECNREDVSTCSPSWNIETTRNLCRAYLDPIYSGDKVYRNWHCAICNSVKNRNLKCSTEVISSIRPDYSYDNDDLHARIKRGAAVHFARPFPKRWLPTKRRVCCGKERWDPIRKICRMPVNFEM